MTTENWMIDITPSWWAEATAHEQAAALESIFGRRSTYKGPIPPEFLVSPTEIKIPFAPSMEVRDIHPTMEQWKLVLEAEGAFTRERLMIVSAKREQLEAFALIYRIKAKELDTEQLRALCALAMTEAGLVAQWRCQLAELRKQFDGVDETLERRGRSKWTPFDGGQEMERLQSFASEVACTLSEFGNGTTDDEVCELRDLAFSVAPDWSAECVPTRAELKAEIEARRNGE